MQAVLAAGAATFVMAIAPAALAAQEAMVLAEVCYSRQSLLMAHGRLVPIIEELFRSWLI